MHKFASSQEVAAPGRHAPFRHASPLVQPLPSLQGATLCVNKQPFLLSHLSSVHGLPSLHASAAPGTHAPSLHASWLVHTSPSLHGAVLFALVQPVMGSQLSVVHGLPSSQLLGTSAVHRPSAHVSCLVQLL